MTSVQWLVNVSHQFESRYTSSSNLVETRSPILKAVQIHLSNMWKLTNRERYKYIRDRIDYRFKNIDYKDFLIRGLSEFGSFTPLLLKIVEINLQAYKNYAIKPYSGNLTLFRCEVHTLENYLNPDLGWRDLVDDRLEIENIPASHYGILKEPSVSFIADRLLKRLSYVTIYDIDRIQKN